MEKPTIDQQPTMIRTTKFIKRFGLKTSWVAKKTHIPYPNFSRFLNSHIPMYIPQYERLVAFLDEYERRMIGFAALEE